MPLHRVHIFDELRSRFACISPIFVRQFGSETDCSHGDKNIDEYSSETQMRVITFPNLLELRYIFHTHDTAPILHVEKTIFPIPIF